MNGDTVNKRAMGRTMTAACLCALIAVLAIPAVAAAGKSVYPPKRGKIFHGLTYSGQSSDTLLFNKQTRSHSAVSNYYVTWGDSIQQAIEHWDEQRMRGLLTITASRGHGLPGVVSPLQIVRGRADSFLLQMNRTLGKWRDPVYISLFPEMNGHWNAYSAFEQNGNRRKGNSTKRFKQAWRRTTLIMRGGRTAKINGKLKRLGMRQVNFKHSLYPRKQRRLATPKVAMVWIPQSHGSPNVRGNGPGDYWPGPKYVDWVGADTFSKFSNFDGLNSLRRNFAKRYDKPMMLGEYAPWGSDASGWVKQLHAWARRYTRMFIYYQGFGEIGNPFQLDSYPKSKQAIRRLLNKRQIQSYAEGKHTKPNGGSG